MDTQELTEKGFAKLNLIINTTGGLHPLDEDTLSKDLSKLFMPMMTN